MLKSRKMIARLVAGSIAATAAGVTPLLAAGPLAPYRAVYVMKLVGTDEGSDISSVSGRLVIEWQGSACEGYVTNQRIVNRMGSKQGDDFVSDFRVSSWESADGNDFTFSMTHYVNGGVVEEIEGDAERSADGAVAHISKPERHELSLPRDVVFPTEQIRQLLAAGQAGKTVLNAAVFDGSETQHHFATTTFFGDKGTGAPADDEAKPGAALAKLDYWPVQVSYFNPTDNSGLPDYEVAFRFYENGVSSGLVMDYGDLVIGADLVDLQLLPVPDC